jgi:diguanylate cyclase (GGDEF)-like protein
MPRSISRISQSEKDAATAPDGAAKPRNIRILLAGDNSGNAAQALRALFCAPEHELELTVVSTVATLLPTLGVVSPEIIVLDLAIAEGAARETVRRVHRAAPGAPLIVLADEARKEHAKQTLSDGAIDYILREFMDGATLSRIFRGALERNTLEGLADMLRDPVTGLYTRDGLMTIGSSILERTRRNGGTTAGTTALFCIWLQNLADLRRELGNGAADSVLQALAATLGDCFRRSDILGRIGDAQFAVVAVEATESGAGILRQRLERRLALLLQVPKFSWTLHFSVSGGMWDCSASASFGEFLDSIESGLRTKLADELVPA